MVLSYRSHFQGLDERQWVDERNLMFVAIANPVVDMF